MQSLSSAIHAISEKMDGNDYPPPLSTTGTGSFSESEGSYHYRDKPLLLENDRMLVASPIPKSILHDMDEGSCHFRHDEDAKGPQEPNVDDDNENDENAVVIEIPSNFPLLLGNQSNDVSNNKVSGLWPFRSRVAHRQRPRRQKQQSSCSWDEDHLSSAAVWSGEESLGDDVGTEDGSRCRVTVDRPVKKVLLRHEKPASRDGLRFSRSLIHVLLRRKTKETSTDLGKKSNQVKQTPVFPTLDKPIATASTSDPITGIAGNPSQLLDISPPQKHRITQARRAQMGFARTVAMDGILESFSDAKSNTQRQASTSTEAFADIKFSRTVASTVPGQSETRLLSSKVTPSLDYVQILKDQRSSPLPVTADFDERRGDASIFLVWV